MELKLLKETEMPLLSRKRVNFEIEFEGATPSEKEILSSVAKKLKAKEDQVFIRHIYPKYGETRAKVIVHLYESPEKLKDIEEIKKKKKVEDGKKESKE